jgi:hypothetical protein
MNWDLCPLRGIPRMLELILQGMDTSKSSFCFQYFQHSKNLRAV